MSGFENLLAVYQVLDGAAVEARARDNLQTIVLEPNLRHIDAGWSEPPPDSSSDVVRVPAPVDLVTTLRAIKSDADAGQSLTTPQKTRLFSAIADVARVSATTPDLISGPLPNFAEPASDEALMGALAELGPDEEPLEVRKARVVAAAPELFEFARKIKTPEDFQQLTRMAVERGVLPVDALYVGTCTTEKVTIDGHECAVIDTQCSSPEVSLKNLLAVVNPFNWADNCPQFFASMLPCGPPDDDGWGRVLETVGLLGVGNLPVTTQLTFYTSNNGGFATLDFDLDKPTPGEGDGQVRVDRGWINMTSTSGDPSQPGVRVSTRKIVRIERVSTVLQQTVGLFGYGNQSAEMLFGRAKNPPATAKPFDYLGEAAASDSKNSALTSPAKPPPADNARHFAPTAVAIWTDTVRDLTNDYADVAGKWTSGKLTADDFVDYAAKTTDHMVRAPFAFLQAMTSPRIPPAPNSGSAQQGGES
jgi:hypothetical protein